MYVCPPVFNIFIISFRTCDFILIVYIYIYIIVAVDFSTVKFATEMLMRDIYLPHPHFSFNKKKSEKQINTGIILQQNLKKIISKILYKEYIFFFGCLLN